MTKRTLILVCAVLLTAVVVSVFGGNSAAAALTNISSSYSLYDDGGYLYGLPAQTSAAAFCSSLVDGNVEIYNADSEQVSSQSTEYIATGYTVKTSTKTYVVVVLGDTDGDGIASSTDYIQIKRYLLGTYDLSGANYNAANIDCLGEIDTTDYLILKRYFLGTAELNYKIPSDDVTSEGSSVSEDVSIDPDWVNQGSIDYTQSGIDVSGDGVSVSGTAVYITKGGDFEVTGASENTVIYVNAADKVKLRLSGVDLKNPNGPVIYFQMTKKAFITVTKDTDNYLTDGSAYSGIGVSGKGTVFSEEPLEIKGSGNLFVTGNYRHAICCDDEIYIENSNITVISAVKDGIHVNDAFSMIGGTLNISDCGSDAIQSAGNKSLEKGTFVLSAGDIVVKNIVGDAVKALGTVDITGGSVTVNGADNGIRADAAINISGGVINVVCTGNGIKSSTTVGVSSLADITLDCGLDGIDGVTGIQIDGGVIVIEAADMTLQSLSDIIVNGGDVTLSGGTSKISAGGTYSSAVTIKTLT